MIWGWRGLGTGRARRTAMALLAPEIVDAIRAGKVDQAGRVLLRLISSNQMFASALNALVQSSEDTAIGAATATFGGLGILSGLHTTLPRHSMARRASRWAPLAGGVIGFSLVLLAWLLALHSAG
jgi:hypothetical protein